MMIKCPRCGFEQPKDQYCAQCGVDIEKFHVKESPAVIRLLKNPILQIGLILGITSAALVSFYGQYHFEFEQKVKWMSGQLQVSSSNSDSTFATPPSENSEELPPNDPNNPSDPNATEASEAASSDSNDVATGSAMNGTAISATGASTGSSSGNAAEKAAVGMANAVRVKVLFLEVPAKLAQKFYQDSQMTGQFSDVGGYYAGVLPDLQSRLDANKSIKLLAKIEGTMDLNQALNKFFGTHPNEPERELGIATYVELTDIENNGTVRGNFEVLRSWKETPEGQLQKSSYPAIFELPKSSGFFISGVLPHRTFLEMDESLIKIEPFSILRSQEFKANQSDFFVVLSF